MSNNKITLPKGSYHAFCRKMYAVQEPSPARPQNYYHNQRRRHPQTVQTQRAKKIDQFNTFQEYMSKLNNHQEFKPFPLKEISKTVAAKNTAPGHGRSKPLNSERVGRGQQNSYKKMPHQTQRQSKERRQNNEDESLRKQSASDLIGAFLPFFKVKLQKEERLTAREKSDFKIDNRKFRLKSLLVEQNKYVTEKWFPVI